MHDFVLAKAVENDDAVTFHDRPDAVLHAQRWPLKFAKQSRITQSLGKSKSTTTAVVSVHTGWDAGIAADHTPAVDVETEFKTVTHGRVRWGVSHMATVSAHCGL